MNECKHPFPQYVKVLVINTTMDYWEQKGMQICTKKFISVELQRVATMTKIVKYLAK